MSYLQEIKCTLVTVVIDKLAHVKRYSELASHPYHYCLTAMMERYCGFLNFYNAKGDIMVESRGKVQDNLLKKAYYHICPAGTQWRKDSFFTKVLTPKEIKLKPKVKNIAGIQISDLLAHPIKHEILLGNGITITQSSFGKAICEIVTDKHNKHVSQGRISGYGKIFLK